MRAELIYFQDRDLQSEDLENNYLKSIPLVFEERQTHSPKAVVSR